ncbi:MAG: hypothetical protein GY861_23045, partial [bacterium]|nr:hypothetical protein [bacterium]
KDIQTYFNSDKILQKCLGKPGSLSIEVYAGDLIKSTAYPAKVTTQNIGTPMWRYGNQDTTGTQINATFNTVGCHNLQVWAKDMGGQISYFCKPVNVIEAYGSDADTRINSSKLLSKNLNKKSYQQKYLHFNYGSAPIAPKLKGGQSIPTLH